MRFYWFNSTLGLTVDTISTIVTQYNNTAITRLTTIYGDVNSLDISTITTAQEMANSFAGPIPEYVDLQPYPPIVLANGTDGSLFNGVSIPYPTPYVEFAAFAYVTLTKLSPDCPAGQQVNSGRCECALSFWYPGFGDAKTSLVSLSRPYYTILDSGLGMHSGSNYFQFDNLSLSEWFMSDTALIRDMPQLSTCFYNPLAHGPPGVKIPVSALTASSVTTVQGSGQYTSHIAQPGDSVTALAPAPTLTAPVVSKTPSGPSESTTRPDEKPGYTQKSAATISDAVYSAKVSSSSALILPDPPSLSQLPTGISSLFLSSDSTEIPKNSKFSNSNIEPNQQNLPVSAKQTNPTLRIIVGGSTIFPDTSNYALPGTLTSVSLLALSATTIMSNSDLYSQDHVGQPTYAKVELTPILSFGTFVYTADLSSQLIISGQTVKPGGPAITVAGTPISLDADDSIAVIGTSTQPPTTPAPIQKAPILTFAGSTFTANSVSEFVVAGQTLRQGSQITVSDIPISLNSGGTIAIIGTSTQNLIHNYGHEATEAPPPPIQETPVLTFGGSTFTANSASEFIFAGQTLRQGSQITVSDIPISLNSGHKIAIVGTSTQNLIHHNYGPATTQASPPPIQETPALAFGGSTITANSASDFVVVGQTLTQGSQITVSGTPISLAQNGQTAVIGTTTQPLIHDSTPTLSRAPVFTLGATAYTADMSSHFFIEGQTLVPGGVLTIVGTRISYPPTGSDIVIGTSTEAIHLGDFIVQGFGGATMSTTAAVSTPGPDHRPGNGSTTGGVEGFPGAAHRALEPGSRWGRFLVGLVVGWCILR